MNKALIGVMSCERDAASGCHDAIRRTWVTRMVSGLDYKIFVGRGTRVLASDEERLDVPDGYACTPDGYDSTPEKAQAMRKWALEHSYGFMFKADHDTYLSPVRLLASGFEQYDYVGYFPFIPDGSGPGFKHHQTPKGLVPSAADARGAYIYASGGCGYWTSKRAMEALVAAPIDEKRLDVFGKPAEDLWVPNVIFPLGIRGYHDPRYRFIGDRLGSDGISVHLGCGRSGYQASWMDKCHSLFMSGL